MIDNQPAIVAREGDRVIATLPELTCELPGGLVGYFQRDFMSCHRAAIATVLQVDYEEVPADTYSPGKTERIAAFLAERGLREVLYQPWLEDRPPVGLWIAVSDLSESDQPWGSAHHATVCFYKQEIFDPASGWVNPDGWRQPPPAKIELGSFFVPLKEDQA